MSVKFALDSLNLYGAHISVRRKGSFLGGGSVDSVIAKYGNMIIDKTFLIDNVLVIYVL